MSQIRRLLAQVFTKRNSALAAVVAVFFGGSITFLINRGSTPERLLDGDEVGVVVNQEIKELIGKGAASLVLGATIVPYKGKAEVLKGTPNTTGLIALNVNDVPVATVLAPKSPLFELRDVPVGFRSTAISQILLSPGLLTGDPTIDIILLAVLESLPETQRVEESLRRESLISGAIYLSKLSASTRILIDEAAAALVKELPNLLKENTPPVSTTTTVQTNSTIAGASYKSNDIQFRRLSAQEISPHSTPTTESRPSLPPTCDVGIQNYTGLEHDNVCFSRISGGGTDTPSTTKFVVENRSPRWALVYLDKAEISIGETLANKQQVATSTSLLPDAVIAPKEWVFPDVLDMAIRFATALSDSSAANSAKEILNYVPWVQLRVSDDSLAEQIELKFREFSQDFRTEIELETSTKTRMTSVTAGLPRTSSYSGYVSLSTRDEMRRLIAIAGTIVSTVVVPTIRVILDLERPTSTNKACALERQQRGAKTFVALSNFVVENAQDVTPFAESLIGATPDTYLDGVIKTAPNALRAILTSSEPWTMIGYYLFSNCDDSLDAERVARINSTIASLGYDQGNSTDIIAEYANEEIRTIAKDKIKEAILKRLATMSTGWGALVNVVEAAPDIANVFFGLTELMEDSWKYDSEDSYFFVNEDGKTLVSPPWPQQAWSVTHLDSSNVEIRRRPDGTLTLSSETQLVVIDAATGALKRKYEVIGVNLIAYNDKGKVLWQTRFQGLLNFRLRDLSPRGHPILESSFFFFGKTLEVFNKDTGAAIGQLYGNSAVGEVIWVWSGRQVSIYNADTLELQTTVELGFSVDRMTRQLDYPGGSTVAIGDLGETASVDKNGIITAISTSGLINDDGPYISAGVNTECGGPIFRKEGKLNALDSNGQLRWMFPREGQDNITNWEIVDKCNLYVGDDDGRLWYIDKTARSIWAEEGRRLRNRLSPISSIRRTGATLLVGTASERELFALDADTGQDLWRLPLDAGVTSILTTDNYVVIALSNGLVKRIDTVPIAQTP